MEAERISVPVQNIAVENLDPEPSDRFSEGAWVAPVRSPCFLFSSPLDWGKREGWNLEAKFDHSGGLEGGTDDGHMKAILSGDPRGLKRFRKQSNKLEVSAETKVTTIRLQVIYFYFFHIICRKNLKIILDFMNYNLFTI